MDLPCIPEDQTVVEQKVGGQWFVVSVLPGMSSTQRSARVLRIPDERPHEDFLWQRSPYGGSQGLDRAAAPLERPPTVDYLLPYWMLRYYTEVRLPDLAPWSEWYQRTR